MKIIIKNKKSDKESAYKSGINLPNTEGVDWDAVNPGAKTGPKKSDTKFNTMSMPMMGTNFQVSIDAGKEKEFDNLTPIETMYMENVSKTLNEGTTNDEGGSDYKYEWILDLSENGSYITINNFEQEQTLSVGDKVKFIFSDNLKEMFGIIDTEKETTAISYGFPLVGKKFGSLGDENDLNVSANTPVLVSSFAFEVSGETGLINFAVAVVSSEIKVGIFSIQSGATVTISATSDGTYSATYSGTDDFSIFSTLDETKFNIDQETLSWLEQQDFTVNTELLNVDIHPLVAEENIDINQTQSQTTTIPKGTICYKLDSIAINDSIILSVYIFVSGENIIAGQFVENNNG